MYLSNFNKLFAFTLILVFTLILSSCSSMGGSVPTPSNKEQKETTDGKESLKLESVGASSEGVYTGPDPMADIQINSEIKKAYSKVSSLNKLKKYKEAITVLDKIQGKFPQLSGPDYQKARIYFNQNKLDEALQSVDASLANNARNYYSLNLKGVILREKGDFEAAKNIYMKAIEVYPPYPNSHLNLGVLADIYIRNLPLALMQYQEYMKLTSNKDKTVSNWIIEIERRIKAENK